MNKVYFRKYESAKFKINGNENVLKLRLVACLYPNTYTIANNIFDPAFLNSKIIAVVMSATPGYK